MPGRQVQQATFDAIVREAISDFGLTPEEAVAEAREQLRKTGITDLSNIHATVPSSPHTAAHPATLLLPRVQAHLTELHPEHATPLLHEAARAARTHRAARAALQPDAIPLAAEALVVAAAREDDDGVVLGGAACSMLTALCENDEIARARFVTDTRHDGVAALLCLVTRMSSSVTSHTLRVDVAAGVIAALAVAQRRNERVKRRVAASALPALLVLLRCAVGLVVGEEECDSVEADAADLLCGCCLLVRQLLSADDVTVQVAETFNRARVLTGSGAVTDSGLAPLSTSFHVLDVLKMVFDGARASDTLAKDVRTRVLIDAVQTLRLCAVSDESCSQIVKLGFQDHAFAILQEDYDVLRLVETCMALLRNVAGRDECKTGVFNKMAIVHDAVVRHMCTSAKVVEQYCALISSVTLRRTDLARRAVMTGLGETMLDGMSTHSDVSGVQRAGCAAIRNMCSRSSEVRQTLRDGQRAEAMVRKAGRAFPNECGEVAYCALRDLDVLEGDELRRDERYTMPAGFYNRKIVRARP